MSTGKRRRGRQPAMCDADALADGCKSSLLEERDLVFLGREPTRGSKIPRFDVFIEAVLSASNEAAVWCCCTWSPAVPFDCNVRSFLQRHAKLLRALPRWTLQLFFIRSAERMISAFANAVREQLTGPVLDAHGVRVQVVLRGAQGDL